MCEKCGQSWRAATLEGWKLWHDPNVEGGTCSLCYFLTCFHKIIFVEHGLTKKGKKIDLLFDVVDEKTLQLLLFNLLQLVECKE